MFLPKTNLIKSAIHSISEIFFVLYNISIIFARDDNLLQLQVDKSLMKNYHSRIMFSRP